MNKHRVSEVNLDAFIHSPFIIIMGTMKSSQVENPSYRSTVTYTSWRSHGPTLRLEWRGPVIFFVTCGLVKINRSVNIIVNLISMVPKEVRQGNIRRSVTKSTT